MLSAWGGGEDYLSVTGGNDGAVQVKILVAFAGVVAVEGSALGGRVLPNFVFTIHVAAQ